MQVDTLSMIEGLARRCNLDHRSITDLSRHLVAESVTEETIDALLARAIEGDDVKVFNNALMAALDAKIRIDAQRLIKGMVLLDNLLLMFPIYCYCTGDLATAFLEAYKTGQLANEREATALLLAYAACQESEASATTLKDILTEARVLARNVDGSPAAMIPLHALAELSGDPHLEKSLFITEELKATSRSHWHALKLKFIDKVKADPLALLPSSLGRVIHAGQQPFRKTNTAKRNDPCPCGSGKKYKKCCLGKDPSDGPLPAATPEHTAERIARPKKLSADSIRNMRAYELKQVTDSQLDDSSRPKYIERLALFHLYDRIIECLKQDPMVRHLNMWYELIDRACEHGDKAVFRELIQIRESADPEFQRDDLELKGQILLFDQKNELLDIIEREALEVLNHPNDGYCYEEFARGLLSSDYRALGILVARGALSVGGSEFSDSLLDCLFEARGVLDISPDDPIESVVENSLHRDNGPAAWGDPISDKLDQARDEIRKKADECEALKKKLQSSAAKLNALEQQKKKREADARPAGDVAPRAPAPTQQETQHSAEYKELRMKFAAIKEELKAKHNERNAIRRELMEARDRNLELESKSKAARPAADDAAEVEDDFFGYVPEDCIQPPRAPSWNEKFLRELGAFSEPVQRATYSLIGQLAAGDKHAFQGVRRLKRNRDILRQRVGHSHRLLFRIDQETLTILSIIDRRDLEKTIQSLLKSKELKA